MLPISIRLSTPTCSFGGLSHPKTDSQHRKKLVEDRFVNVEAREAALTTMDSLARFVKGLGFSVLGILYIYIFFFLGTLLTCNGALYTFSGMGFLIFL